MNTSDLDDIAPVIGYRATRIVVAWFAGRQVWVPREARDDHPLRLLLGPSAFMALVREFGGRKIAVPSTSDEALYVRNRQIAEYLAAGWQCERIGRALGITARRVEQIRAELVRNGWLTYAQGFHPETPNYPPGRRRIVGPKILGTSEVFGESPQG